MKIKDFKRLNIDIISSSSFDGENFSNTGEPYRIGIKSNKHGLKSIFFSFLNNNNNLLAFNKYFELNLSIEDDILELENYDINISLPAKDSYNELIIKFNISSPDGKSLELNVDNLLQHILYIEESITRNNGVEVLEKENLNADYEDILNVIIEF